uniref:Actinoporin-like protein n=1 Tax=Neogobius melanostomus TaxID=47308 RepID=A0A8C6TQY8_9GOBI
TFKAFRVLFFFLQLTYVFSSTIQTNVKCIHSLVLDLCEPCLTHISGQWRDLQPPQPTVRPLMTEVCTFTKSGGKATGAVGVLTYDLFERTKSDYIESVAIMFSVPWDYNFYKNWFAVGLYPKGHNCDENLFKEMYNDKTQQNFKREEANGSGINHAGNYLDVRATMCPMAKAIMNVEVWDKLLV